MNLTRRSSQSGQTLIEVLVTALVVLLVSAATATALVSSMHASGDQRLRAQADTLASQDQERMRGLSDEQLAALGGSGQSHTATANGVTFTITSTTAAVDSSGMSSCTTGSASDFRITSAVSWTENSNPAPHSVSADSLLARPVTGDLLTTVTDQTGAALPGVSVAAATTSSPTSTTSGVTDSNGCLLFAGLNAGGYTVQFSKSGYVDTTGSPTHSSTVSVSSTGTPTKNTVSLGLAGAIAATFTGAAGASTTTGDGDAVSYVSSGNPNPTTIATTSATTSLTNLYPWDVTPTGTPSYTNNYTVWAGKCAGQEPPTGSQTTTTVAPGASVSVKVLEPELNIQTTGSIRPVGIKLTYASTSPSCADSWLPPVAASVSPATGWLSDPGQPYAPAGTLTVCAWYTSGAKTYYGKAATLADTSLAGPTPVTVTMSSTTKC